MANKWHGQALKTKLSVSHPVCALQHQSYSFFILQFKHTSFGGHFSSVYFSPLTIIFVEPSVPCLCRVWSSKIQIPAYISAHESTAFMECMVRGSKEPKSSAPELEGSIVFKLTGMSLLLKLACVCFS